MSYVALHKSLHLSKPVFLSIKWNDLGKEIFLILKIIYILQQMAGTTGYPYEKKGGVSFTPHSI